MVGNQQSLEERVKDVASPLAKALELDLVEITCRGQGAGAVVRVTIDKPGGVSINDCEKLHHSLSRALDVVDPIPYAYRLEVSSPGLDRPLKREEDFRRSIGKFVRISLLKPLDGESVLIGRLLETSQEGITVSVYARTQERRLDVGWDWIGKARLEVRP